MAVKNITFNVGVNKLESFKKKMEKLQQAFLKDGGTFNYNISEIKIKEVDVPAGTPLSDWFTLKNYKWTSADKMAVEYVTVDLEWSLKNEDWKVIGIADRQKDGKVTYHTSDKGQTIPKEFYDDNIRCDHCKKNRKRNQGIIIRNENTKEIKMVGTACLKEFTGLNVDAILQVFRLAENPNLGLKIGVTTPEGFIYNVDELLNMQFCRILAGNYQEEPRELALSVFAIYNYAAEKYKAKVRQYLTSQRIDTAGLLIEEAKEWIKTIDIDKDVLYREKPSYYINGNTARVYSYEDKRNAKTLSTETHIKYKDVPECMNLAFMYIYNTGKAKEERDKKIAEWEARQKEVQEFEKALDLYRDYRDKGQEVHLPVTIVGWNSYDIQDNRLPQINASAKIHLNNDGVSSHLTVTHPQYGLIFNGKILEVSSYGFAGYLTVNGVIENDIRDIEDQKKKDQEKQEKYNKATARSNNIGNIGDVVTIKIAELSREWRDSTRNWGSAGYFIYKVIDDLGGQFRWFSPRDFVVGNTVSGTISKKEKDFSDKNLDTIVLQRVQPVEETAATTPAQPVTNNAAFNIGDNIKAVVTLAERGLPFMSYAGYELLKITFTDNQNHVFEYVTKPGSYLDKNLQKVKKIEGTIKSIKNNIYSLRDLKVTL